MLVGRTNAGWSLKGICCHEMESNALLVPLHCMWSDEPPLKHNTHTVYAWGRLSLRQFSLDPIDDLSKEKPTMAAMCLPV